MLSAEMSTETSLPLEKQQHFRTLQHSSCLEKHLVACGGLQWSGVGGHCWLVVVSLKLSAPSLLCLPLLLDHCPSAPSHQQSSTWTFGATATQSWEPVTWN